MSKDIEFPEITGTQELIMPPEVVIELYNHFENNSIEIRIDGSWGVDALLGEQTRPHDDLDIVVQTKDVPKLRELLAERGYDDVERDDTSAWNFVLGDNVGHEIDIHVITYDERGNGIYGPPEKGVFYPASSLTGTGSINGQSVRCISAEDIIKFHSGYKLKEKDYHDVKALCDKFGIPLPEEYMKFES